MTWFRVDDSIGDHPKVDALADGAHFEASIALWMLAGAWCAKHLTDGHVPSGRASRLGVAKWKSAASELVRVGLWIVVDDGWQFHDWTAYQPTREAVTTKRERVAERVRRHRNKRVSNTVGNGVTGTVTNGVTNGAPDPTRPDPTTTLSRSGAREPLPLSVPEGAWWSVIGRRGGKPVHAHDDATHWRTVAEAADALVPDTESPRAWLEAHLTRWLDTRTSKRGPKPAWWADTLREEAAAGALGQRPADPRPRPPDAPLRYVRPDGSLTDERREAERDRVTEEPRENPEWWAWKERQAS